MTSYDLPFVASILENMADQTLGLPAKETKKRGGKYCVAGGPHNTSCMNTSYSPDISMHKFPKDEPWRSGWTRFVQRYRPDFVPSDTSTLCSIHFEISSFERDFSINLGEFEPSVKMKRFLKRGAVPTIDFDESYTVCLTPVSECLKYL